MGIAAVQFDDQALLSPDAVDLVTKDFGVQLGHRQAVFAEEGEELVLEGRPGETWGIRDPAQCIPQPLRAALPGTVVDCFG